MTDEMEPCPFCGAEAVYQSPNSPRTELIVRCLDCGATVPDLAAWNRRAGMMVQPFSEDPLFLVRNTKTGKLVQPEDLEKIALSEGWASNLMYCDMEGFAILENGELVLLDECGQFVYVPGAYYEVEWKLDWRQADERKGTKP